MKKKNVTLEDIDVMLFEFFVNFSVTPPYIREVHSGLYEVCNGKDIIFVKQGNLDHYQQLLKVTVEMIEK